jgi:phosphoribosylamine--glycine ligase
VYVFHAGTRQKDGVCITDGGRVLGVTALGDTVKAAIERAYQGVGMISWTGMQFRSDIGKKAVERE